MARFLKLFYRKPPDGLLEMSEGVYVFDCCFSTDVLEDDEYKVYMGGIVGQLRDHFPDATFMVFSFKEGERHNQISNILSEYDMTVMDYPRHYEGCPLLTMEMIHHFLRSSESWLSLGPQNIILMHCERGGWPVLAFMLAGLLIYRKHHTGEQKTLDMIYKQAPRELLQLLSPLNPQPSQLRYLQYLSRRNVGTEWPPLDRALTLDCIILRMIPNFNGEGGCRPIFRIYGKDPFIAATDQTPKVLFSTPKKSKSVRFYKQSDCELVKIDIQCHIQGDVVLECISLDEDLEREEMMFRVMFNTAFIRSNILMLNRDEIDILWNAKDRFPKDFRAEVLLSEMDAAASLISMELANTEEKEGLPMEAFAKVQEIFSSVDWIDSQGDAALQMLQQITSSNAFQEQLELSSRKSIESSALLQELSPDTHKESLKSDVSEDKTKRSPPSAPKKQSAQLLKPFPESEPTKQKVQPPEILVALQRSAQSKIISQRIPQSSLSNPVSYSNSLQSSPLPMSRYHSAPSALGITALLHDHAAYGSAEVTHSVTTSPPPPSHSITSGTKFPEHAKPISSPEHVRPLAPPPSPPALSTADGTFLPQFVKPISSPQPPQTLVPQAPTPQSQASEAPTLQPVASPPPPLSVADTTCLPEPKKPIYSAPPPIKPSVTPPSIGPTGRTSATPPPSWTPPPPPPPPPPPQKQSRPPSASEVVPPMLPSIPPLAGISSPGSGRSMSVPPPPPPPPSQLGVSAISSLDRSPHPSFAPPFTSKSTVKTNLSSTPPPPPQILPKTASSAPSPPPPPPMKKPAVTHSAPPPPPPPLHSGPASGPLAPPPPPPPLLSSKHRGGPASPSPPVAPPAPPPLGGQGPTKGSSAASPQSTPAGSRGASAGVGTPSPPLGANGRGLTRSTTPRNPLGAQSTSKRASLKPLHWVKVTRAMQGSLWAESQKSDEFSKAPEFDLSELESLFSAAVPNTGSSGEKSNRRASLGPKSDKIHLIDMRRAYNCEIMLSKVKMPLPDLMSTVLALDDSALDVDQVDNLIKYCPTKEDMELLKGFSGDKESLGRCEQFFLELMKVPRVESKLRVFSFKIQFSSQVSDLSKSLNIVNSAAEEVRKSAKLKRIMQTILSLGNALNQGTARGSAIGFRLDSLLKLIDTRALNNKMTLMHYLCKVLAEKLPELLDFQKDLVSLEAASKIQLKTLAEEMQAISKGLEKVEQELAASENDGPVSQTFRKTLKEFLVVAEAEVRAEMQMHWPFILEKILLVAHLSKLFLRFLTL
ncbi:formin-like protein 18 isoform X2 [Tasmannia lanceolata]|uniref:formin-like protein 18 isoform X2 n=1 Tax=Tasmannia lanceolata TaxID=3420 RepID=UPI004062D431